MSQSTITLEQVEILAATLEAEQACRRERLLRLIRAEARILAVREPDKFAHRAMEYADEDGAWDNSYPPKQRYKDYTGPRLIKVSAADWSQIAVSEGFYYSWRAATSELGLYVARDGMIWGCTYSGTGKVGQFAARPGDCGVRLSLEWAQRDLDDISDDDLVMVEETLRDLAFPLTAAAQPTQTSAV